MKDKISLGIIVLISFIMGGLSMYYFSSMHRVTVVEKVIDNSNKNVVENRTQPLADTTTENGNLSASVNKVANSVVMVKNYQKDKLAGSGSGFIYKIEGNYAYIMTNHHVVNGGTKFTIITNNDEEIEGKVLGSDEYVDLAVIKVAKKDYMASVALGSNSSVHLGDTVFTIGSPVGYEYRGTVTNGIVSGLNRLVEVSVKNSNSEDWVMEVIQTNAAVNPGNSGGPLFNINGEVIGIISMKLVQNAVEGMGFAIPIDYAMSHVKTLEEGKTIERPLLGISMLNVTDSWQLWQQRITLPKDVEEGVVVVEISENSGAAKSGLQSGDVIVGLNKANVKNAAYLKYLLYKYNPGDVVEITYNRDGKISTTKITLTKNES